MCWCCLYREVFDVFLISGADVVDYVLLVYYVIGLGDLDVIVVYVFVVACWVVLFGVYCEVASYYVVMFVYVDWIL